MQRRVLGGLLPRIPCLQRYMSTIGIGLSGGVDSSVAALLLKRSGHEVVGIHMQNWDALDEGNSETPGVCSQLQDVQDARKVANQLGIELIEVSFVKEYWHSVFQEVIDGYSDGITPNPDVLCNSFIKFGSFLEHAKHVVGVDGIATGHYARFEPLQGDNTHSTPHDARTSMDRDKASEAGTMVLKRAVDHSKDQSYFLAMVAHASLMQCQFPLGHLNKSQVREIARIEGLITAEKKDSMGLCFVGKRNFPSFLAQYVPPCPAILQDIVSGHVLGEHPNMTALTIGQKAKLSGQPHAWFVAEKDMERQVVWCAPSPTHPSLYHSSATTTSFHWLCPNGSEGDAFRARYHHLPAEDQLSYKVRYRQALGQCHIQPVNADRAGKVQVHFTLPQKSVTIGQTLVLYHSLGGKEDICLGGGPVQQAGPSLYAQGVKETPPERWDD